MKTKENTHNVSVDELTTRFPSVSTQANKSACSVLGTREHLVKEVVNAVLLQLWKSHRNGKPPRKLSSWVNTVAKRLAYRALKAEEKYAKGLADELSNEDVEFNANYVVMPHHNLTPAALSDFTERVAVLRKLVGTFETVARNQLNEREALLFELYYRRRLRAELVAFELGLNPAALRKQWSRLLTGILEKVRTQLKQDPLCEELLSTLLANEETFRSGFLSVLHVVMQHGVGELERLVLTFFET